MFEHPSCMRSELSLSFLMCVGVWPEGHTRGTVRCALQEARGQQRVVTVAQWDHEYGRLARRPPGTSHEPNMAASLTPPATPPTNKSSWGPSLSSRTSKTTLPRSPDHKLQLGTASSRCSLTPAHAPTGGKRRWCECLSLRTRRHITHVTSRLGETREQERCRGTSDKQIESGLAQAKGPVANERRRTEKARAERLLASPWTRRTPLHSCCSVVARPSRSPSDA